MSRLIAALIFAVAVVAMADDNSKLDELGQVPRIRVKFDGSLDSCGEENVKWSGQKPKSPEWNRSRGGKALKLSKESGYPEAEGFRLGGEWTLVAIAKGASESDGIIWSIGSGRGRGSRALALAGTGRGGVKLVTWQGRENSAKVLVLKDVPNFSRQFHVYAVAKTEDGAISLWVDGKKAGEANDALARSRILARRPDWCVPTERR